MDWTEVTVTVPREQAELAAAIASMVVTGGVYVEDYGDLEEMVQEIAHIDLIDEDLLQKNRENAIVHVYISPEENPAEVEAEETPVFWGFANCGIYSGYQLYGSLLNNEPTLQGYVEGNFNLSVKDVDLGFLGVGVWSIGYAKESFFTVDPNLAAASPVFGTVYRLTGGRCVHVPNPPRELLGSSVIRRCDYLSHTALDLHLLDVLVDELLDLEGLTDIFDLQLRDRLIR